MSVQIDEIFMEISDVFGIGDYNLIKGYDVDGKEHDKTLRQVMQP